MSAGVPPTPPGPTGKLDVVRKLLAKAERAATPAEAEAYTAKAVELCARHGIDAALAAADGGHDPLGSSRVPVPQRYSAAHARLLGWVAAACGCRVVLHQLRGGRVTAVTVFGHAADRERVLVLHASLVLQVAAALTRVRPPDPRESVAAYRRSWLLGFAREVHQRLSAAESTAAGPAGSTLVRVVDHRRAAVESAFALEFPALGQARRPALSGTGYVEGGAAGALADLGGGGPAAAAVRAVGA